MRKFAKKELSAPFQYKYLRNTGSHLHQCLLIPVGCIPFTAVAVWGGCIPACTGQGCVLCIPAYTGQEDVCLGVSAWGWAVSAWGCLPGGVCLRGIFLGGVSQWGCLPGGVCHTPPCGQNDRRMTHMKTLPCRNYVADGNDR